MAELADALDLGSSSERSTGSIPASPPIIGTKLVPIILLCAHMCLHKYVYDFL